jgi:hypothetical protein
MSLALFVVLAPFALFAALLFPALSVQFALKYWFRPAERVSLEEAWSVRFDEHLPRPSSAFQS